ncbi:MAG: sigma-70 family RNA polymerase sigma factor [Solirubrobacteraceae bacterium]
MRLDSEVLEGLFLAHGDAMVRYFARRTFDLEASFDLVSETFAQAVESQRRFRGGTREEAVGWLYGIARHQLSQYIRCGHVERRAMQRLGLERVLVEDDELRELERQAGLDELRAALAGPLRDLPGEQRRAVLLRVVEERSYAEVAAALAISEQTARARVSRGLRRLASSSPPLSMS